MGPTVRPALLESDNRLWQYLRRCVQVDTRTLAVFRVVVGVLVVADLLLRSRNFEFFYTDDGVVPRSLAREATPEYAVSVYHLTTDPTLIAALFVLQGLLAVQLIVGYRTRLATALTFLFVVSLDHHNPFVLSYADTLFRLLLFWALFLPLGERWSVDAVHRDRPPRPSVANAASALILGQMVYMYVTNGLIKAQSELWTGGDAAPLVFGLDEMTFFLGDSLRAFPTLLEAGGLLWFYMLVFAWLLILLRGRARMLLAGLFVGGHLAFALTVRIGAFPYVALAGVLLFLQAQFWDDLATVADRAGVDRTRLEHLAGRLEALATRFPNPRLGDEGVRQLRARTYDLALAAVVVTVLFVAVAIAVNVAPVALESGDGDDRPIGERVDGEIDATLAETTGVRQVETAASSLGIDQPIGWGVFAGPHPRTTDRYYVFPAETASGELIDAYNERALTYERPYDQLQNQHGTYRERFYMNSVRRGSIDDAVPARLAEHRCERWPDDHGEELVAVNMYVVEEAVTAETIDDPANRDREYALIYRHGCGDNQRTVIRPPT
ncbi:HTTM domain-containing protein [Natrialbaceae archaeon AArc-T1-2]|uniref:HTTM domain-containing protein n=1 Tax=Natrialbaceae archaeon AArc-T1-2 TaxID=3053904 RepID=UPI00255B23C9|nr:HTTM domain-containing protein [Natrialbaceae archaeon AArc-T1-2]WIV65655.1 HTTM domain-containing protein [Natrialbaceae archaeon AArc-T1-2]